ncbi:hypothetical protein ABEB36_012837 [Hypothenemus hampei]|uniref:Uncharacterized protein n=1 Tax=Hypothenemus hampei TaxID=57062 RepID=A0ABD1E6V4_HYPHA
MALQISKSEKNLHYSNKFSKTALVQGDPFYNIESCEFKTICKRGKSFQNSSNVEVVDKGVDFKSTKLKDVRKLIHLHFGETWNENEKLQFGKDIFSDTEKYKTNTTTDNNNNDADSPINSDLECLEDDAEIPIF